MTVKQLLEQAMPLPDSEKLRVLALWFDAYDNQPLVAKQLLTEAGEESNDPSAVQRDLRRIADCLLDYEAAVEALEAVIEAWDKRATNKPIEQIQALIPTIIKARAALRRLRGDP
jgi:hypothetical protein